MVNGLKENSKNYPIIDVPANGNRMWVGGAYSLCFVYSKYNGNFILRGYSHEVNEYLAKNYTHYFYYKSLWSNGRSRGGWYFWKKNVYIMRDRSFSKIKKKYFKMKICNHSIGITHTFKRFPNRWIAEFDNY